MFLVRIIKPGKHFPHIIDAPCHLCQHAVYIIIIRGSHHHGRIPNARILQQVWVRDIPHNLETAEVRRQLAECIIILVNDDDVVPMF